MTNANQTNPATALKEIGYEFRYEMNIVRTIAIDDMQNDELVQRMWAGVADYELTRQIAMLKKFGVTELIVTDHFDYIGQKYNQPTVVYFLTTSDGVPVMNKLSVGACLHNNPFYSVIRLADFIGVVNNPMDRCQQNRDIFAKRNMTVTTM